MPVKDKKKLKKGKKDKKAKKAPKLDKVAKITKQLEKRKKAAARFEQFSKEKLGRMAERIALLDHALKTFSKEGKGKGKTSISIKIKPSKAPKKGKPGRKPKAE